MTTRIEPINWDEDRYTIAARANGWATPWVDEHATALAAQEAADKAAAGGQPDPAPAPGAEVSQTPHLDAYLARCQRRFPGNVKPASTFSPDPESKSPQTDEWMAKCRARFARKVD